MNTQDQQRSDFLKSHPLPDGVGWNYRHNVPFINGCSQSIFQEYLKEWKKWYAIVVWVNLDQIK